MTREEAAEFTRKLVARAETIAFPKTPKTINNIPVFYFEAVLSALRGPEPDPETGLVPCGCGGKAETHELYGEYSGTYMTDCKECGTGTTQYSTKKESRDAWNTAMGRASE